MKKHLTKQDGATYDEYLKREAEIEHEVWSGGLILFVLLLGLAILGNRTP